MIKGGRPLTRYITDPMIAIGIPISFFLLLLGFLALAGFTSFEAFGNEVEGLKALMYVILAIAALPLIFIFVGVIAWFSNETRIFTTLYKLLRRK